MADATNNLKTPPLASEAERSIEENRESAWRSAADSFGENEPAKTSAEEEEGENEAGENQQLDAEQQQIAANNLLQEQQMRLHVQTENARANAVKQEQEKILELEKKKKKVLREEKARKLSVTIGKLVATSVGVITIVWYVMKIIYYATLYKGGKRTKAIVKEIASRKSNISNN